MPIFSSNEPPETPAPPGAVPADLGHLAPSLQYHCHEFGWQQTNPPFGSLLPHDSIRDDSLILDVGCGAGQTLRLLGRETAARRVGVDQDLPALALGLDWNEHDVIRPTLIGASAHVLPFPDDTFTHVLCRVALNYMPQARALAEMVRVLRPGGVLLLRIERVFYDAWLVSHPTGLRSLVCRLRDLGAGLLHEASGWQPMPGRRGLAGAGRAFASRRRLTQQLHRLGCDVIATEPSAGCARCLGASVQLNLRARRRTASTSG